MRGEQTATSRTRCGIAGSPPLARGTGICPDADRRRGGITPACAGNSHKRTGLCKRRRDHPRLRGEQYVRPLARVRNRGITPACAGNSKKPTAATYPARDHPRLRGEQNASPRLKRSSLGSPPLARGTGFPSSSAPRAIRITPACAGNSRRRRKNTAQSRDHPRLRGEQAAVGYGVQQPQGSPPLARGTVEDNGTYVVEYGITPACAGNRV